MSGIIGFHYLRNSLSSAGFYPRKLSLICIFSKYENITNYYRYIYIDSNLKVLEFQSPLIFRQRYTFNMKVCLMEFTKINILCLFHYVT